MPEPKAPTSERQPPGDPTRDHPPHLGVTRGSGAQFYHIDFSLQAQLSKAGAQSNETSIETSPAPKDPIARRKRLRQFRAAPQDDSQRLILAGMKDIAKDGEKQKVKDQMTEER